jgi:hypothetical protein
MLACSDGDVSIFRSDTNHLNDINTFPSEFGPRTMRCRFTPTAGPCLEMSAARVSQALAAGSNSTFTFLSVSHQVVEAVSVLRLRARGRLPGNGRSQSPVLRSTSQGFSALPRRGYPATRLPGSARTAESRDADSAAICESESHIELGSLQRIRDLISREQNVKKG